MNLSCRHKTYFKEDLPETQVTMLTILGINGTSQTMYSVNLLRASVLLLFYHTMMSLKSESLFYKCHMH